MRPARRNELPPDAPVRIGDVIGGKYRVERLIGRGGMGFVVAAEHIQLGGRVAIKLLHPHASLRPAAYERFLREGRAAARIRSEHVARVYDLGALATGEPYLVLELLEGQDLQTVLHERGPLSVGDAVTYVVGACEALAEAHALGIVHRDLKPANLFLVRRGDGTRAIKIIDFGISKIGPSAEGAEPTLTGSDAAFGTVHYMAPEQMRSARDVDARADVWSLGALLHELLTAAPPFPGATMVEVYDRALAGAPSVRASRPEVPPELDAVVGRCLRFDPVDRYDDVGQLVEALAELALPEARSAASRGAAGETAGDATARDGGASRRASLTTEPTRDLSWVDRAAVLECPAPAPPAPAPPAAPEPPAPRARESPMVGVALALGAAALALGTAALVRARPAPAQHERAPADSAFEVPPPASVPRPELAAPSAAGSTASASASAARSADATPTVRSARRPTAPAPSAPAPTAPAPTALAPKPSRPVDPTDTPD